MKDPRLAERVKRLYEQGMSKGDIIAMFSASGADPVELGNIVHDLHSQPISRAVLLYAGSFLLVAAAAVAGYVAAVWQAPERAIPAPTQQAVQASPAPSLSPEQASQENIENQELMLRCLKDPSYKLCVSKESAKR
jgi:hypothetical protein